MKRFKIGKRSIGREYPPFIIAEAGINHGGSFKKAMQLVDAAIEAGAECVKFQCHITEAEMLQVDIRPGKTSGKRLWDIIKGCELTEAEEKKIKKYCDRKEIVFLSTPFSKEAVDRLCRMDVPAFKIGSGECNNLPLLEYMARLKKPMILSTGMNDADSIQRSLESIGKYGCPVMLMHCTSIYPTPYDKVRLGAIKELEERFGLPVGLSDHSEGIYTCLGAVAIGACVLEKHFTVSRKWPGPDISISIEPDELADLVSGAKAIWQGRGGTKTVLPEEEPVIDFAHACVVAIRDIKAREIFSVDNIWVKRPGTGEIKAGSLDAVLGKKARSDIKKDTQIKWEYIYE